MNGKYGSLVLAGTSWSMVFILAVLLITGAIPENEMVWFFWCFFLLVALGASSMNSSGSSGELRKAKNLLRGQTLFIESIDETKRTIKFKEDLPSNWSPGDSLTLK